MSDRANNSRAFNVETHAQDDDPVCVRVKLRSNLGRTVWTDVSPPYRLRITSVGGPVTWAVGHARMWGLVAFIERPLPSLPHLSASECRRVREQRPRDAEWWTTWAVHFTQRLHDVGLLGRGVWTLERAYLSEHFLATSIGTLKHRVIDASSRDERNGSIISIDWSLSGENALLPLRELDAADEGRIKALTKLAADGELPPVLAWWHSGLQRHLIIDGHVRVEAFRRADRPVLVLALSEQQPARITREFEEAVERRVAEATRAINDPEVLSRVIAKAYADRPPFDRTTSAVKFLGGTDAWDTEASVRSPAFDLAAAALLAKYP